MKSLGIPPKVGEIANGSVTWERLEDFEFELTGYFLSCHLAIEHYMLEYLKIRYEDLDWDSARLTFAKKATLLSQYKISDRYDSIPAIKHLNTLRNKLAHDVSFKIQSGDLQPLIAYLERAYDRVPVPTEPKEILSQFTTIVCAGFAAGISYHAQFVK